MFGRLAGNEGVNDAERLWLNPAKRTVVDCRGPDLHAGPIREIGRFETEWLVSEENDTALFDLPGAWIDRVPWR